MNRPRTAFSFLFLVLCAAALAGLPYPRATLAAAGAKPAAGDAKPRESPPAAKPPELPFAVDALGRTTPYGTVFGFLRAVDRSDYEQATRFLEGRQPLKQKEELARDLAIVLNRGLRIGLEDLSRAPEGRLDDDLNVYLEKVGTARYDGRSLDIILRRTTRADTPPIWLFSSETLAGVSDAANHLEIGLGEAVWPEAFRDIRVLSYPLYRLLNLLASLPAVLAVAWLLNRLLQAALGPLLLRRNEEFGRAALARTKSLVFLLLFAVLMRVMAASAVTVTGRIFFTSLADVLIAVSVTWLLVRITKLTARWKALRLKKAGMMSSVAAIELSGWVVATLWVIAGALMILHSVGFEATAAIAGLGVGGIAIAFAAQKTLENLFGTVTIVTDKPIRVGDYCQAGTTEGSVEAIGLRSTRIRTPDRALVTIPNGQLATMAVGNITERDKFLFKHNVRLRYDTSAAQLRGILVAIRTTMIAHPKVEAGTLRTRLVRFGDYSLDLEVFAYVLTRDVPSFLEIQEDLLLRIMDIIEAAGLALALPFEPAPAEGDPILDARLRDVVPPPKAAAGLKLTIEKDPP